MAAGAEYGLTTQLNVQLAIPNHYDDDLIAFLEANDLRAGYTSYWIAFRLAFLSEERLQYSSSFPYKPTLDYTPADERYPPYRAAADRAENPAYITASVPEVKDWLETFFAERDLAYDFTQLGPYSIYYNVRPSPPRPPFPFPK